MIGQFCSQLCLRTLTDRGTCVPKGLAHLPVHPVNVVQFLPNIEVPHRHCIPTVSTDNGSRGHTASRIVYSILQRRGRSEGMNALYFHTVCSRSDEWPML